MQNTTEAANEIMSWVDYRKGADNKGKVPKTYDTYSSLGSFSCDVKLKNKDTTPAASMIKC